MRIPEFLPGCKPWHWGLLSALFLGTSVQTNAHPFYFTPPHLHYIKPLATITGSVTNEQGEPLIGATVKVKGKNIAVTTDEKGNFSIDADPNSVLVISYTGYESKEVAIRNRPLVDVVLVSNSTQLNEVVITALGIKKQAKSLGYSTTQIPGSDLTESRVPNLANALSGQVAGVSVAGTGTGPTGSTRVIIRGNTSLTKGSTPLYIIDGVPFEAPNQGSSGKWGGPDFGDPLSMINPDDIESINVLKGVAASALYGHRGGNGVILITTKSGNKSKGIGLEINNNTTVNKVIDQRDFQFVYGQGSNGIKPTTVANALETATYSWGAKLDGSQAMDYKGNMVPYVAHKDNWKNFLQTGLTNQTTVALSGTNAQGSFRLGVTNMNMKETIPNSSMAQQGLNFNSNYNLSDKLHLSLAASYMFEKVKNRAWFSDSPGSVIASLFELASSYDIRSLGPTGADKAGNEILPTSSVWTNNPYWVVNYFKNTSARNRYTGNLSITYDLFNWLSVVGQVNRNNFINDQNTIVPTGTGWENAGTLNVQTTNDRELNGSVMLDVNKKFGSEFSLRGNLGVNSQDNVFSTVSTGGGLDLPRWYSVNNIVSHPYRLSYGHTRVNSVYGSADIGFREYLFLSVTARNDWFSTLNPKTNNYLYPSIATSFVFSEALKMPAWLTFGKIRASYAKSSRGAPDPYQLALSYENISINYKNLIFSHVTQITVPNAFLKPVDISEAEVGMNLSFLNNRISIDAAVYSKETKDDILTVGTSTTSGYGSSVQNIGKMRNRGVELLITGVPVQTKEFSWKPSFNIATNSSRVLFLSPGVESIPLGDGDPARYGTFTIKQIVGMQYGQLMGFKYKRDAAGNKIFGADGLPLRTDDLVPLGSGVYKTTGGFSNEFRFNNFTLSALIDFKFGAKIYSVTNADLASRGLHKNTLQGREGGYVGQGVTENGSKNTTVVDAQTYWTSISGDAIDDIAEEYTYDASFIKLRNLSIGYIFPQSLLSRTPIKGLTFSLVGRNVATLLKHIPNVDPESNLLSDVQQGVEYDPYPAIRSLGFNLNVKF